MASVKAALKSALEDRSPRFLLGTIALGVVISLVVGFGIGYAAHTGGGSGKKATKQTAAQKKAKAKKAKAAAKRKIVAAPTLTGGIFAVKRASITVLNAQQKGVKIAVGNKTRVAVSRPGTAANVVVGAKVLYRTSTKDPTKATQVIVLPPKALVGETVSAVVPGTSLTVKQLSGDKKITTKGATIWVTAAGTKKKLIRNEVVTVQYYLIGAKKKATATQVVVMPLAPKVG